MAEYQFTKMQDSRVPAFLKTKVEVKCTDSRLYPVRAHSSDAGADLRSTSDHEIYPGESALVDTGVAVKIPVGYVGLVVPRSSMGKVRIMLANTVGVIDADYRGNIKVMLANDGENIFYVKEADTRIAQLIITPVMLATFVPFERGTWEDTERGSGGFGSTGV